MDIMSKYGVSPDRLPDTNSFQNVPWVVAGHVSFLYHVNVSESIQVQYDEVTVFGSHGAFAVWTGTSPRSFSVSGNMVAANCAEIKFNLRQVANAYAWTQQSPPPCEFFKGANLYQGKVRIEGYESSVEEGVFVSRNKPVSISLSLTLKECRPI